MRNQKEMILMLVIFINAISIATAIPNDAGNSINFKYQTNYSTINVNNSQYLESHPASYFVPTTRTITMTSPLQGSGNLGSDVTISITQASSSTAGYIVPDNFISWNNKSAQGKCPDNYAIQNISNTSIQCIPVGVSGEPAFNGNFSSLANKTYVNTNIGTNSSADRGYCNGVLAGNLTLYLQNPADKVLDMNGLGLNWVGEVALYNGAVHHKYTYSTILISGGTDSTHGAYINLAGMDYVAGSPGKSSAEFTIGANQTTTDALQSKFSLFAREADGGSTTYAGFTKLFSVYGGKADVLFAPIHGTAYFGNGTNENIFKGEVVIRGNEGDNITFSNDGTNLNLNFSTGTGALVVYNSSGKGTIVAGSFRTSTGEYDKSQGSALNLIKDASTYMKPDGTIDHSAYGDCARDEIVEDCDNITEVPSIEVKYLEDTSCEKNINDAKANNISLNYSYCPPVEVKLPYLKKVCGTKTIANATIDTDCLRARYEQAIYELIQQNKALQGNLTQIKSSLGLK